MVSSKVHLRIDRILMLKKSWRHDSMEKAPAIQQNLRLNGAPRTYVNAIPEEQPTCKISTQRIEAGLLH